MPSAFACIEISRIDRVLACMPEDEVGWLSASEQTRCAGIHNAARRSQYLAGHWLTRVLLARAFDGHPTPWQLVGCKGRPPQVLGHEEVLRISISHSDDWVAVAVATVAIGIDLEQRPRKLDATIEPLLLNIDEEPGCLDADQLLQRWVAKEAWIKRDGGSALPEQVKRLQLHPAVGGQADVRIESHPAFHFGLAVASDCDVKLRCDVSLVAGANFSVR